MRRMKAANCALLMALMLAPPALAAEEHETDIAGTRAKIALLKQYDGVLHVGIVLHNPGNKEASLQLPIDYSDVVVIECQCHSSATVAQLAEAAPAVWIASAHPPEAISRSSFLTTASAKESKSCTFTRKAPGPPTTYRL